MAATTTEHVDMIKDSDDESSEFELGSDDNSTTAGNPAWADAINKILRVPSKTTILSKAKKDSEVKLCKNETKSDLEVVKVHDGDEKTTDANEEKINVEESQRQKDKLIEKTNRDWETACRKKPDVTDRDRERALARIATKGVVQMFNAVKSQQVTVETKLQESGSERKREKVIKSLNKADFIDILKGKTDSINVNDEIQAKKAKRSDDESTAPTWDVFRDDFMLGAKMKDWDKQTEENLENDVT